MKKSLKIFNGHKGNKICKNCICGKGEQMKKSVLVLGSDGLVGRALINKLKEKNYKVYEFDKKSNYDILDEKKSGLLEEWIRQVDFVFFLAFDVGGSQYLQNKEHTFEFISNNIRIMETVFSYIKKHNKPFIFASSMMSKMPHSTYGLLKSIGERYTKSLDGISVRLWNIYGYEEIEEGKNHVITDFIISSLEKKEIICKTNGKEVRQFLHVNDLSNALKLLMLNYDKAKELSINDLNCVDISSGTWTQITDISGHIADITNSKQEFLDKSDRVQYDNKIEPNLSIMNKLNWKSEIDLVSSIKELIILYLHKK